MIVHQIHVIDCHKGPDHHQYTRKRKPLVLRHKFCGVYPMKFKSWTFPEMRQDPHCLLLIPYLYIPSWDQGGGGELWLVKYHQNLEDHKNEVFPPRFLKNMHCQGKGCYGKGKVKAVALIMNIEPSGTRREEILQQSITNIQESQNLHARPDRMP